MKKIFLVSLLLMLCTLALGQTNLPPCDPNNAPPNCTDYFGVANWANSPLPAGAITGFTIISAGTGYVNPVVVIADTAGAGAVPPTTFTYDVNFGITAITGGGGGSGYIAPQVTVVDVGLNGSLVAPTCGALGQPACGSGAIVTATIGGPVAGGIRKFVDTLPLPLANLSIAVPDTTTFQGSDYYVIALQEYTTQMHTDLHPTRLRGYVQLNNGTPTVANPLGTPPPISYLGPTILAVKNRPVRVLFKNMLPIGTGGNLFVPVDTTYMGAGAPYTQNRATLHLHGGATPWISDGTPHQWTVPIGESGPQRGDSVQMVPDMWFDSTNGYALIASCAGQPTCATPGATNDPGQGSLTFFWTNQQGGRLMFYHDHAYGLTRLNVYAGEAAGYLLVDPTEEAALAAATVPGTVTLAGVDLAHLVPLVIQDKTFVPSAAQLAVEDPTWVPGGFGTIPGTANPGDLWFPHVYTPNQNPADVGGANAFGRWDYGPWTLPGNQTVLLAANPQDAVTIPCTSAAFLNQAVNCPITPNPSGTPESFMDTPLVNGKAYPVLHVAPEAYRFRMLSAGNDRSLNLQFYLADSTVTTPDGRTNTEVKMVPAIQPAAGSALPLCTAITPITNTTLFMGLATAILDATGNPINGTGLPANCWPTFGSPSQAAGIPVQQTMWAADGRAGGVPDPTKAGPPFIQIGTEGGLLPAPVVIPSMPTGYEANTRSVTITNVSVHGLWLGPAERADAIVDFSNFAGKTLILYNDAPTPAPAVDSRLDYFTGDGDQTSIGGAPNTLPGYGPNTRTIMQIVVDGTPSSTTKFSLPALTAALPSIFAQTQPVPIVPEPTYPPASGAYSAIPTYSLITDASLTFYPIGSTSAITYTDERKTIQELFTLDYGRMNATLGVELPLTNFLTQTTIPLGYIDPPTEIIKDGETQLWHITHNGVDTHFIHFHLFNVQVINRSAWDGTKRPPDPNELGWKDTVRMNPLEDILVALKPIQPIVPFPLRDSYRMMDVTNPAGSDCAAPTSGKASPMPCSIFTNIDPATNIGTQTPNKVINLGWEYVWHCHILGHEENDMMRAMAFNVAPEAPSNLTVAAAAAPAIGLTLSWTDNSASETGFTLERANDAGFTTSVLDTTVPPITGSMDINGQGITWGGTQTYNDTNAAAGPYFYRVRAFKPDATYWTPSPNITSAWSNTVSFGGTSASVSPLALAFGTWPVASTSTPALAATLSNTGTASFTYTLAISGTNLGDFAVTDGACAGTAIAGAKCALSLTFTPSVAGPESASLIISTTDPANPTLTVSLTGTGGSLPLLTITANNSTMRYGSAVPLLTFSYNPANPAGMTTAPACSTTATKTSPVGTYPITCTGAADANYTLTYVAGTMSVTPAPLTIWASNGAMVYGGTPPVITPEYVGLVAGDTAATFSISPNVAPTCTTTPVLNNTTPVGTYPSICSGATDPNYTISYAAGKVTVAKAALSITSNATRIYGAPNPSPFPLTTVGLVNGDTLASAGIVVSCTTTATTASPVGTYPITCTGPASTLTYIITYTPGTLTVTPAPASVTPNAASKVYGTADPVPLTTGTLTGFLPADNVTATYSRTAGETVTGSPYTISATLSPAAVLTNYAITYNTANFTITPAVASVTPNAASKVYGTADPAFTGTLTGFLPADGVTATYSRTAGETVAGSPYTISATLSPAAVLSNYTITYNTAAFTITPAVASVTPNPATKVYGTIDPAFTGTLTGFVAADNVVATYTRTAGETVAGSPYTISATLAPAAVLGNYAITYNTAKFTITPAAASVTPNAATKVYGTADPILMGTLTGFVATDNVVATYTRTAGETVAGSPYTISATLAPAAVLGNYTITYNTAIFTITPAVASVTPNAATKVYGTADPILMGTLTGFVATDNVVATYTRTAGETVAGSPYTISATLAPAAVLVNYTITYNTANFTITGAPASVTPSAASKVYGMADPVFTGTLTGFLPADGVTATYARTPGEAVAGSPYKISATLAPAAVLSNYTITYNTANFTITPAVASVTPNAATKVYGTADPVFTGALTGFLPADGVTATYARTPGEAVAGSPYKISATLAPTAVLGNYTITYNTANFTITPAALVITAGNGTMIYGGAVPLITPSYAGFVNGDTAASLTAQPTCSTTATPLSNVGSYPSSCSGAVSTNYAPISYVAGTVTVTKASLVVTAPTLTRVWGFANPALTPVITGFVNGQTSAVLTTQPVCSTTATAASAVGVYPVTCSGGTATNYAFASYVGGTLTVTNAIQLTPASLTFAVQNIGTNSPFQTVTLRNLGGATLTTVSITFTGANAGDFIRGGNGGGTCGATLAAAATCTINVRFRPTAGGLRTTNLSVTATGSNSGTVGLTGTGNGAVAVVAPATTAAAPYNFGSVTRGQVSAPLTVTVTNNGTTTLTFNAGNGFTLGGGSANQFRLTTGGSCVNGGTLAALSSCTFTVNFAPTAGTTRTTKNSTVTIRSNATNGNRFVYVRGTAQ